MKNDSICISELIDSSQCVGCGACINCCPTDALSYGRDPWGYYIPVVDKDKCIGCGRCVSVCPINNSFSNDHFDPPTCFAFISGDKEILEASSSGGVFTRLAQYIFDEGGVVYGAAWNDDLQSDKLVRHIAIRSERELSNLRKSKYLQSFIGLSFREVKRDLEMGKKVLFSGCPCQVSGLNAYLGKDYQNLILVDLLCGNSPSEQFFREYISDSFGTDIEEYEFRHKEGNWRSDCVCVTLNDGERKVITGRFEDDFQSVYHDHTMCPPHCENCIFHSIPRVGDISIGDFWGVMRRDPTIPGQNGVSAVLINSKKGRELFDSIKRRDDDYIREVPVEWIGGNGYTGKNDKNYASVFRDQFYEDVLKMGFSEATHIVQKKFCQREIERYRSSYEILLRCIMKENAEEAFAKCVSEKGLNRIAIYGMGDLGKLFYRKLKGTDIEVAYAIDKRPRKIDETLKVIDLNGEFEPVDAIIVTIMWEYGSIRNALKEKTDIRVISLSELI